jgi:SAM-dependent methyltransferase
MGGARLGCTLVSYLPDYVQRNRASWDAVAQQYVEAGRRNWAADEPSWGIWGVPESQVRMLPADLDGLDAIELGCGTAYGSAWLAQRGARPVGIDNSEAQLETARVEALTELRPPEDATTRHDWVTLEWARQWPSEEVWRARKRG